MTEHPFTHVEVTHEWGRLEELILGIQPRDGFILPDLGDELEDTQEPFGSLCRDHVGESLLDGLRRAAR